MNCAEGSGFTLGVALAISPQDGIVVHRVEPDSAADRAGLRQHDRLLSVNGTPLEEAAMDVLDPLIAAGEEMEFRLEREGQPLTVSVKPLPK